MDKDRGKKERAKELCNLLNEANHAYYVLDSPIIEDPIYDKLYRELLDLEKENPSLIFSDSPSQRLGGKPAKKFESVEHRIPLSSLDNAFNTKELINWYKKIEKILSNKNPLSPKKYFYDIISELKIDGNALALSYSDGLLVRAATRGNGLEGEEITANAKTISSIPLKLKLKNPPKWLEIRGEAFIPDSIFKEINHLRKELKKDLFANPRNACAGTLRQLNSKIVAQRKLDFFAYTLHLPEDWNSKDNNLKKPINQWEALNWLERVGFKVNPHKKLIKNFDEIKELYETWESKRMKLEYATDGIVIKINDFNQQALAGFTQRAPRWAIALKFAAEEAPSQLIKITYQVGRTGVITPVAEFKPVSLAGTSVSKATLHNADRINDLDLHTGDTIVIRKAGEIIPEIVRVIKELRLKNSELIKLPNECPECKNKLLREKNEAATRCININCPAIVCGSIRHWASKNAMNIDGLGEKLIEQLVNKKLVNSIADLYTIKLEELMKMDRIGEKSANKILLAIKESKKQAWSKQLYGLGISHIGESNAKALAEKFLNIYELESASKMAESFDNIYGIGEEIIESLCLWFQKPNNKKIVNNLLEVDLLKSEEAKLHIEISPKPLSGVSFVITGKLPTLSREEVTTKIEKAGGKVIASISKNTNYLVSGEKSGNKLKKANELGIEVIDEAKILELTYIKINQKSQ